MAEKASVLIPSESLRRHCRPTEVAIERKSPWLKARATYVEPKHLRHVVVTSVARDDLAAGGACVFADAIRAI